MNQKQWLAIPNESIFDSAFFIFQAADEFSSQFFFFTS